MEVTLVPARPRVGDLFITEYGVRMLVSSDHKYLMVSLDGETVLQGNTIDELMEFYSDVEFIGRLEIKTTKKKKKA